MPQPEKSRREVEKDQKDYQEAMADLYDLQHEVDRLKAENTEFRQRSQNQSRQIMELEAEAAVKGEDRERYKKERDEARSLVAWLKGELAKLRSH